MDIKKGDFVRIVGEVDWSWRGLNKRKIYKVTNKYKCPSRPNSCKGCPTKRWRIETCHNYKSTLLCGYKIVKHKRKGTSCVRCKEKLFCTINSL